MVSGYGQQSKLELELDLEMEDTCDVWLDTRLSALDSHNNLIK